MVFENGPMDMLSSSVFAKSIRKYAADSESKSILPSLPYSKEKKLTRQMLIDFSAGLIKTDELLVLL
jgi:hypothetical protein